MTDTRPLRNQLYERSSCFVFGKFSLNILKTFVVLQTLGRFLFFIFYFNKISDRFLIQFFYFVLYIVMETWLSFTGKLPHEIVKITLLQFPGGQAEAAHYK